jgi:hypothetical protein
MLHGETSGGSMVDAIIGTLVKPVYPTSLQLIGGD